MHACGINRPGFCFYGLRHVFRTVADAARDHVAIDMIMGHADPSMAGHYRERIEDERLVAVAERVRRWLFELPPSARADQVQAEPREPGLQASPTTAEESPTLRLYAG